MKTKTIKIIALLLTAILALSACQASGNGSDWIKDAVIYEVNLRQYTKEGTIESFREHLPRLKDLGVEILWFMPVHPISKEQRKGTLGSYYAIADYKGFNPEFGTLEEFKELVKECHKLGFKVILDWVANHTGWDNQWLKDNPEWYTQVNGKVVHPIGTDWTDVADLNYDNKEMREAMLDSLSFWVKEADIDGYRCDVAGSVPVDFWEEARIRLDKIKPVYMLAEDGTDFNLMNKAFNSNYNWRLLQIINNVAKGKNQAKTIWQETRRTPAIYPEGTYPMNFITNHDENSWNGTAYERLGEAVDAMQALTFIVPGIPLIYSGQEASLNKRLAFFEKDEIDWTNTSKHEFYKKLISLKKDNPSLWNGSYGGTVNNIKVSEDSALVLAREKGSNKVIYIANLTKEAVTASCDFSAYKGSYKEAFTGKTYSLDENTQFELGAWEYLVLTKK